MLHNNEYRFVLGRVPRRNLAIKRQNERRDMGKNVASRAQVLSRVARKRKEDVLRAKERKKLTFPVTIAGFRSGSYNTRLDRTAKIAITTSLSHYFLG